MPLVNELDAADPVARGQVAMPLLVVLPPYEIPQKIPPIHMPHLIAEEKPKVIAERGLFVLTQVEITAVILLMGGLAVAVNPRKNGLPVVFIVKITSGRLVFLRPLPINRAAIFNVNRP